MYIHIVAKLVKFITHCAIHSRNGMKSYHKVIFHKNVLLDTLVIKLKNLFPFTGKTMSLSFIDLFVGFS